MRHVAKWEWRSRDKGSSPWLIWGNRADFDGLLPTRGARVKAAVRSPLPSTQGQAAYAMMQRQQNAWRQGVPGPKNNLGRAITLTADAVGEPGNRRFRLLVEAELGGACLWLEKEQLFQLAIAIQRLLSTMDNSTGGGPSKLPSRTSDDYHEFQVGRLMISEEVRGPILNLLAKDQDDSDSSEATVGTLVDIDQLKTLSERALEVCAAGRPRCPLCGTPMGPEGHQCVRTNGYHKEMVDDLPR